MESSLLSLALLLEGGEGGAAAAQIANRFWQRRADVLLSLLEPSTEGHKAQAVSLRCLRALALVSEEAARGLVQRAASSGSSVVALLGACERPGRSKDVCAALAELVTALLRSHARELLTVEHGRLAAAPLRLVEWLPRATRIRSLVALRHYVLENQALSARTKAPVINSGSLAKLAPLLTGSGELARVTHGFLLRLSAVHAMAEQHGMHVASVAGGVVLEARSSHAALTQLLLALQPTQEPSHQQIVLAMLGAVPALRNAYLTGRGDAVLLESKATRRWLVEVAFIVRVLGVATSEPSGGARSAGLPAPLHIPPGLGRPFWSRTLLHSNTLVRCTGMNALVAVLQLLNGGTSGRELSLKEQNELRWSLPDLQTLLTISSAITGSTSRLESLMRARLLQAIVLCKQLLPSVFAESRQHFERNVGRTLVEAVPLVQNHALRLLLPQHNQLAAAVPTSSDTAYELPAVAELCCIMQSSLHSQHWQTRKLARALLVLILDSSGTMRGCKHSAAVEACVWLRELTPATAPYFATLVHHVASSLHASLDAAIVIAGGDTDAAPGGGNVVGSGNVLNYSPIAVAAAEELGKLSMCTHRRSKLVAHYLYDVLAALSRLTEPRGGHAIADLLARTASLSQRANPIVHRQVATACRRRGALPANKLGYAPHLPRLLSEALHGESAAAWLSLRLPVDTWLWQQVKPSWILQSPVQALLHASAPSIGEDELATLLLDQLRTLACAMVSPRKPEAAAVAGATLCILQHLRAHLSRNKFGHMGTRAGFLEETFDRGVSELLEPPVGEPFLSVAPLIVWQELIHVRSDDGAHAHSHKFLAAAEALLRGSAGRFQQPLRCILDAAKRVHAMSSQMASQLMPNRASVQLWKSWSGESANQLAECVAQLALLKRLMNNSIRDWSIDGALQSWLYEHPIVARTSLFQAIFIDEDSTPSVLQDEPLILYSLGSRISSAVRAENEPLLASAAPPHREPPQWVSWLIYQLRGIASTGGMLTLSRHAVRGCISWLANHLASEPDVLMSHRLADALQFLLGVIGKHPLVFDTEISNLFDQTTLHPSAPIAQAFCAVLASHLMSHPESFGTGTVDKFLVTILVALRENGGKQPDRATASCKACDILVGADTCGRVLQKPSLDLVEAVRAFIAGATRVAELELSLRLLSSPIRTHLIPLVAALQNLILRRAPLREMMASPEAPLVLRVLVELMKLHRAVLPVSVIVDLLVGCSHSSCHRVRSEAWALVGHYCQGGVSLPYLPLEQAADVAFCGEDSTVLVPRLVALDWLRPSKVRQMLKNYPVDLLVVDDALSWDPSSSEVGLDDILRLDDDAEQSVHRAGSMPEALGSLLVLRSLLHHRQCDAPRWLAKGAVSLLVMGLSAKSTEVRSLAYDALASFMTVLCDGPSFRERPQVVRLMRSLQDAITQINQRVPTLWAVFLAQGLVIASQPYHPQYKAMNSYVLTRAYFNLGDVPMFFSSFHSGSSSQRDDRLWILGILRQGLRTNEDAILLAGRHVLELLLGFHDSSVADLQARRACLSVLLRAGGVEEGAEALLRRHGILQWIRTQCRGSKPPAHLKMLLLLLVTLMQRGAFRALAIGLQEEAALTLVDIINLLPAIAREERRARKEECRGIAQATVVGLRVLVSLSPRLSFSSSTAGANLLEALASNEGVSETLCAEAIGAISILSIHAKDVFEWDFFEACINLLWTTSRRWHSFHHAAHCANALIAVLQSLQSHLLASPRLYEKASPIAARHLERLYHFQCEQARKIPLATMANKLWLRQCRTITHHLNRILLVLIAPRISDGYRVLVRQMVSKMDDNDACTSSNACAEELLSVLLRGLLLETGFGAFVHLVADESTGPALSRHIPREQILATLE